MSYIRKPLIKVGNFELKICGDVCFYVLRATAEDGA